MNPIQIISQDLFDKVRSRFSNLEMGDETGAVTIDPTEARFFDFDFILEGYNLGRISISINDPGTLKVYYSQGITENQDDLAKKSWFHFLKEMRLFSMRRLLRFDTRDIAKTNLDKNDFQHLAKTQAPKEDDMTTMNESKWNSKSSKKTSRAVQGRTEVIMRHSRPVDEEYAGSRSQRKNIKAIFIQNADGERFKYPFIHPAGAFAMAQHVDHGGIPHDPAGKAIVNMSEQIAQLQEFQRKVHKATLHDDATGITERALGRLQELKTQVECLGKRQHYQSWISEFNGTGDDGDMMLDDVTMEEYKQKFTQTSFQEELSSFFPLLHKIMSEANTVDLEDFVSEADDDNSPPWDEDEKDSKSNFKKPNNPNRTPQDTAKALAQKGLEKAKSPAESIDIFAEWAEAVEQGKLTDDQIELLKQALSQQEQSGQPLQLGPNGQTAWDFFSGVINPEGSNGPELSDALKHKFEVAAEEFPDTDALEVFQFWAQEDYPELAVALGMSDSGEQQPEQPTPNTDTEQPTPNTDTEQPTPNTDTEQPTSENEEMDGPANRTMSKEAVIKEVAKLVKSRFNEDNPDVGPFNGTQNIALDVKKKCAEMFGSKVGDQAEQLAMEFMEKLSKRWEEKHGKVEDDGLARLKELLGNVKAKVEGIGDQGHGGTNFNKNIMSSEEVKKSEIPASQRKAKNPEDWKVSHQDLEKEKNASPTTKQGMKDLGKKLGMSEEMSDIMKLSGLVK